MFVIMYGVIYLFDLPLDPQFFATTSGIISLMYIAVYEASQSIRTFINYVTATRRLKVCKKRRRKWLLF